MENFQRKLTQSENDLKKGGGVAMAAGLKKNLLLALKKVAEQKCKGKLLTKRCGSYRVGAWAGGGGEAHLIFRQTEAYRNEKKYF